MHKNTAADGHRTTIWRTIAGQLLNDINEGRYAVGDKLPTEANLSARFGVNRHTVRRALSHLVEEGLIRTRRGAGTFVTGTGVDYPVGPRVRFHENVLAGGRLPEKRVLDIEHRAAAVGEARALGLAPGDSLCVYHGLSLADGVPIALFHSFFPLDMLPGMADALSRFQSVTAALAHLGVGDFTRASTRLTAVSADASQAGHLHLRAGDPLLKSTSINVDAGGRPLEYGRTYFAGERVTLTL